MSKYTRRYDIDSVDVETIAALLGCEPGWGLVNRLNDLREQGQIQDGMTYGSLLHIVLADLARHHKEPDLGAIS